MKSCPLCNAEFNDERMLCAYDGERLVTVENPQIEASSALDMALPPIDAVGGNVRNSRTSEERLFIRRRLFDYALEGSISEISTQQYYPSKWAKIFRSIFAGEPYQFSHTSFSTIIRVAEQREMGIPEQARDVMIYGNAQTILAPGDDVTVYAKRKRSGFVARRVYNHSSDGYVQVQNMIPAFVIRCFFAVALLFIAYIIDMLIHVNYVGVLSGLINLIIRVASLLFRPVLTIIIVCCIFKYMIKGKR